MRDPSLWRAVMNKKNGEVSFYNTWSDFRHELTRRSGLIVLNQLWFQTKPKAPLPWRESHMKAALIGLSGRILRLRVCPRCGGNLVLDRDLDGYYKNCIQCSFNIAFDLSRSARPSPSERVPGSPKGNGRRRASRDKMLSAFYGSN
jgi:hypothetical protein